MVNTLIRRDLPRKNIYILNNFILDTYNSSHDLPYQLIRKTEDEFHILFAGNIGNFQGLESIIEAAIFLRDNQNIKFYFMGEGLAKAELMKQSWALLGKTVSFIPYQPMEIAFAAMEGADLGVISLKPNVYKVAFPSKTMMYLAAACPVLALVEKESILAQEIISKGLGYTCSQENPMEIAEIINRAWIKRKSWKNKRKGIHNIAQELFGRDNILDKWSGIVKDVAIKFNR